MRRIVALLGVVAACAAVLLLTAASEESSGKRTYKILFDNAFGLVEGGDFRVGNVRAGKTTKFSVQKRKGESPKAVVTAEITEPGFGDFRKDATCSIAPQSLIGEYYATCQPGSSREKLRDGGTVPVEQTSSTIPADLVNNIMRRPYRERFRLIITELGTGLAGRPRDLQEVLKRAHPGLRETSKVLRILGDQNRVIENFIRDSDTVVAELERNKRDVARWVVETGEAAEISATRREDIRRSFRRLPTFLGELRPTMRRLGELADEQVPLLTDLQRAAPDLDTFFARLGPFSEASRPAIRSLGAASRRGTAAFREGRDEVRELRELAPEVQPFAKPLRQLLQTLDDRRRAVDKDPRGATGAPPPPDPTATRAGQEGGFTGFESLWNYFFWQTLTINWVDDIGHALRIGVTESDCSEYENRSYPTSRGTGPGGADEDTREHYVGPDGVADWNDTEDCNQWLGPYQPGINEPDPTDGSSSAASLVRKNDKPASRVGERRGPGQPEAGPLPGQRDISKPQIVLPPVVQRLLDPLQRGLKDGQRLPDDLPGSNSGSEGDNQLLDYLLGAP